jgi:hypothetical protein
MTGPKGEIPLHAHKIILKNDIQHMGHYTLASVNNGISN